MVGAWRARVANRHGAMNNACKTHSRSVQLPDAISTITASPGSLLIPPGYAEDQTMTFAFKTLTLAAALGASALAATAPAEAQRYGGYRGRDDGGAAIIAGVAGLAIGAAIASNADRRDDAYYYDERYEGRPDYRQGYDAYYQGGGYRGYDGYRDDRRGGHDRHGYGRGGYDQHDGRGYDDRRGGYRR